MNRSGQVYNPEVMGRALKTIADRLKNIPVMPLANTEIYGCVGCRHFWSKETYDYQWGMWYFGEHRCKKQPNKGLMFSGDTYSNLDLDSSYSLAKGECPYFERGQRELVYLTSEEKRKYERVI